MADPTPRPKPRRALLWATLAGLLLSLFSLVSTEAAKSTKKKPTRKQKITALRTRLETLKDEKQEQKAELRETKQEQTRLADRLNQSYQVLEDANYALQQAEQRLNEAEVAVEDATERLRIAEDQLREQQRRFGKRIAYYYKEGPITYLDVLMGARDVTDFLDRQYYVSRLMDQDAELLDALRKAQEAVAAERQRLVERQNALSVAHSERASHVATVAARTTDLEGLYKNLAEDRLLQEQRLQELGEDSDSVVTELEQELARRMANPKVYRGLPRWSGSYHRPANGPITSGYGYRTHPVLGYRRLHTGLDIGAGAGSPVFAAADGEVYYASWRGGYGRCIILLHGGEISTLYGHLSRIEVFPGETVRRGQQIGAVGSTGLSTGPHLHFEVRRNGVPVDPM